MAFIGTAPDDWIDGFLIHQSNHYKNKIHGESWPSDYMQWPDNGLVDQQSGLTGHSEDEVIRKIARSTIWRSGNIRLLSLRGRTIIR